MIGGIAPSEYVQKLQSHPQVLIDDVEINRILESHCISPESLRTDNFETFYHQRKQALLILIEKAMGKPIARGTIEDEDTEDDED